MSPKPTSPAIIIPTYNERDNVVRLVTEILGLPIDARVIVVDDNSPDGTGELVRAMAVSDARVHAVLRPAKLGLGSAHIAGIRQALSSGYDPLVTMDADFSHQPREIPRLIAGLGECDIMIGSRYLPGGGMIGRSAGLRLISWGANRTARLALGLRAHDCTSGFRAYRRCVLESLDLGRVFSNGYSFLIEMLFLCQSRGWRIRETPILYEDRQIGSSKISRGEIAKAAYTVVRLAGRRLRAAAPWSPGRCRRTVTTRLSAADAAARRGAAGSAAPPRDDTGGRARD